MSLRRDDHSSRGVLPTVVRRCVLSRNVSEEALTQWGCRADDDDDDDDDDDYSPITKLIIV